MLRQSLKKELPQEMTSASYTKTLKIPTDLGCPFEKAA